MSSVHADPRRQEIFATCLDAAVDLSSSAADRIVSRAEQSMQARAAITLDRQERGWHLEGAQLLVRHQQVLRTAFSKFLKREVATGAQADAARPEGLSFDSLELMAEDQLDDTVEQLRAQQVVLSTVHAELTQLNALISGAQGEAIVRSSANPLRPEIWVRALRDATSQIPISIPVRLRWMHHLSEALGPELAKIYRQLCELLRAQGVTAASFIVNVLDTQERDGAARRGAPGHSNGSAAGASSAMRRQPLLNLRDLRRLLIGNSGSTREALDSDRPSLGAASGAADAGLTVPWSLEALQEMNQVEQVLQRMRQRRSAVGQPIPAGRESTASTLGPAHALGEEVVTLMLENMATDRRLLPEVQQAVRDLQPALSRLVRNDPRFFNDKQHPARRLLSEMAQRSLAWSSPDAPGFASFFEPMRQAVDVLATVPIDDAEPFEIALHSLEQAWGEQEERNRRLRARTARVLLKAEKRNLLAARIADEMKSRPDMATAPVEIRRFLTGPWSQVMAAAQLADPACATDPKGYTHIINDLIWTTQPHLAAHNPGRLVMLVPPLLQTLREGLAMVSYPPEAIERFFGYLSGRHQTATRAGSDTAEPARLSGKDLAPGGKVEAAEPQVWLKEAEARETGLIDQVAGAAIGWEDTLDKDHPAAQPAYPALPPELPAGGLHPGMWTDVFIGGQWARWQLAWASPRSLLYMFTDGNGKYKSMSRSMLDRMVRMGALRVMSHTVLEVALDAVANSALRNSMDNLP